MNKERERAIRNRMARIDILQRQMLEHDRELIKKEENGESVTDNRTIAEQEKMLYEKVNAEKIDPEYFYSHLADFFDSGVELNYYKDASPCKVIENINEIIIPEEYFYSFYHIPLAEEKKMRFWCKHEELIKYCDKELLFYITSRDGENVYIASFLNARIYNDPKDFFAMEKLLSYYKKGIAMYIGDLEEQ